jgi:hypothetical protein
LARLAFCMIAGPVDGYLQGLPDPYVSEDRVLRVEHDRRPQRADAFLATIPGVFLTLSYSDTLNTSTLSSSPLARACTAASVERVSNTIELSAACRHQNFRA